VALGLNGKD